MGIPGHRWVSQGANRGSRKQHPRGQAVPKALSRARPGPTPRGPPPAVQAPPFAHQGHPVLKESGVVPPRCVELESEPWPPSPTWPPRASGESILRVPPRKVMKRDTGTARRKPEEAGLKSREGQPRAFPRALETPSKDLHRRRDRTAWRDSGCCSPQQRHSFQRRGQRAPLSLKSPATWTSHLKLSCRRGSQ